MKFRPGPWRHKDTTIYGSDGIGVAELQRQGYVHEANANGRLIAAAPGLYKALKTIQEFYDLDYPVSEANALRDIAQQVGDVRELLAMVEGA